MVATKNPSAGIALLLSAIVFLAGCSPPGERAMDKGKKYLDQGRAAEAVEEFTRAAELMRTNANAWNYLGLACHNAGQITNAVAAYQRALNFDRSLLEARFNLGCLWLEQEKFDAATSEFTAYTIRRPNDVDGWVKLGSAQLHSTDIASAEKSFRDALRLATNNVEAMNGLALVQLQRKRPREAAQLLNTALKLQPDFRPALLNLAAIQHYHLNDHSEALRLYRSYLSIQPRAADWEAVNAIAKSLEPAPPPQTVQQVQPRPAPQTNHTATIAATPVRPTATISNRSAPIIRVETSAQPATTKPTPPATTPTQTPPPPQVVKVPPEPTVTTPAAPPESKPAAQSSPEASSQTVEIVGEPPKPTPKRGFFSKVFSKSESKGNPKQSASLTNTPATAVSTPAAETAGSTPRATDRYTYLSPSVPARGNRTAAERAMSQGQQAYQSKRLIEAMQAFRQAHQLDPSLFENEYSLGMAAYEARSYKLALAAWENALAIRTDSADARYGFALTLKAAGYPMDSANELEKLLVNHPEEARAHLTLGNLYAEHLNDKLRARLHYNTVLQLDPRNPQALEIRYWLRDNPP